IHLIAPLSFAQTPAAKTAPALSAAEREAASHIKTETIRDVTVGLTAKEMQGRGTGQPGADRAAQYIAGQFAKLGLKPLGDQAESKPGYLQSIKFKVEQVQPDSSFKAGDASLKYKDEFIVPPPLPQDASKDGSGALAFVGYGVVSPDVKRDDLAGIDVKGKIVVMLGGKPNNGEAPAWAKAAKQQAVFGRLISAGAAGFVIVYTPARATQPFSLAATYLSRRRVLLADAPAFPIKLPPIVLINDAAAQKLFAGTGATYADLKDKAQSDQHVSREFHTPAAMYVRVKH